MCVMPTPEWQREWLDVQEKAIWDYAFSQGEKAIWDYAISQGKREAFRQMAQWFAISVIAILLVIL